MRARAQTFDSRLLFHEQSAIEQGSACLAPRALCRILPGGWRVFPGSFSHCQKKRKIHIRTLLHWFPRTWTPAASVEAWCPNYIKARPTCGVHMCSCSGCWCPTGLPAVCPEQLCIESVMNAYRWDRWREIRERFYACTRAFGMGCMGEQLLHAVITAPW